MAKRERSYRTPAVILKRRDFGEADRLLTIITPTHGKTDVIAKGARKPTSRKTGHVELFTGVDLLVHRGRSIDIAAQVEMVQPYLELREDLQRGAYASYVAELLDRFTMFGEEDFQVLFTLVSQTFAHLCIEPDPRLATRYYEIRLLDETGFRPELNRCVLSGDPIQPEDQFFSVAEGGAVNPEAAAHATHLTPISLDGLKLLRHMQRSDYRQVRQLHIRPALHQEVERVLLGQITHILESRLQSIDFIRRIRAFG